MPEPRPLQRLKRRKIPLIKNLCASLKTKDKSQTKGQKSHYNGNGNIVVASLTFGLTFVLGFEAGTKALLSMEFSSFSGVVAGVAPAIPCPAPDFLRS